MNNSKSVSSLCGMFGRMALIVVLLSGCTSSTTASPLMDRRYVPLNEATETSSADVAWLWLSLLTRVSGLLVIIYYGLVAVAQREQKGWGACVLALAAILTSLFLFYQDHDSTNVITTVLCENPDVWLFLITKGIYDMVCIQYQIQSVLVWVLPDMGMIVCFLVLHAFFVMSNKSHDSSPFYSAQDQGTTFFVIGCFLMFNATVRFFCYRRMLTAIEQDEEQEEVKKIAMDEDDEQSASRYELLIV
jgi:hypothetical protein